VPEYVKEVVAHERRVRDGALYRFTFVLLYVGSNPTNQSCPWVGSPTGWVGSKMTKVLYFLMITQHTIESLDIFRCRLKTELFARSDD